MGDLVLKQQALGAVRAHDRKVEARRALIQASLGDGTGTVAIATRPGWVYVRVEGDGEEVSEAQCLRGDIPLVEGVIVDLQCMTRGGLGGYEVVGLSTTANYETRTVGPGSSADSNGYAAILAPHEAQHEWYDGNRGGYDRLNVHTRMMVPLRARPTSPVSMQLTVDPGPNPLTGNYYAGGTSPTFTAPSLGPTSIAYRIDLLYLGADDALHITIGTAVDNTAALAEPAMPLDSVPLACVTLTNATAAITEDMFSRDARIIVGKMASSANGDVLGPASSADNTIARFDGTNNKTIQGSLATVDDSGGINIPTGQTYNINGSPHTHAGGSGHAIQDEGTPLTARANLNFVGAGVTATDDLANNATVVTIPGNALTVKEEDGTPSVSSVTEIKVTNGKLTDNGGGSVSLDLSAAGGSLTIKEADNSPSVSSVTTITVTNGKLTDNTGGAVTLDLSGNTHNLLSATHTDTLAGTVVAGDIITGNATPKWSRLARGTLNYVLKSGASILEWGQVAFSELSGALGTGQHGVLSDGDHTGSMTGNARVGIRKNSAGDTYTRRRINLIEGSNISISHADDSSDEEVDVTIAVTGVPGGGMANDALWDAKGDLAVGTGANTAARLAVGNNGQVPVADSSESTGIRWTDPATLSGAVPPEVNASGRIMANLILR